MKHESNDTPPFAPDDPISRSLFVRPNLIERLCASALRLCLLVCIPVAASVFLRLGRSRLHVRTFSALRGDDAHC